MAASNNCVSKRPPIPSCSRRTMSSSVSRRPRSTKPTCKFAKAAAIERSCLPRILGSDGAGVVAAVGSAVKDFKAGDAVCLYPQSGCGACRACRTDRQSLCEQPHRLGETVDGTYAEYVRLGGQNCFALPAGFSYEEGAAIAVDFLCAWRMLITNAELKPGELVLIRGIGDGVATAALQLAVRLGAHAIVTADSAAKIAKAQALGAAHGIDEQSQDFPPEVRRLTAKRGVDVVVDCIGGENWPKSFAALARGGRLVTCGASAGAQPATDLRRIFWHHLKVFGSALGSRDELRQALNFLEATGYQAGHRQSVSAGTSGHGPAAFGGRPTFRQDRLATSMVKALERDSLTMKVIGGTARGRKLKVPKGLTVRPTAARVKESLFNILPHDFSGLRVLDLYAGSGNVSIEALSRGAVEAVLVDESARSAAVIRENLTRLELIQRAQVWIVPVARALRKLDKAGEKFDLIFLDPPYERGLVKTTLEAIGQGVLLNPAAIVVVEHSGREAVKPSYGALILNDQRRYGDTLLSFFDRSQAMNPTA